MKQNPHYLFVKILEIVDIMSTTYDIITIKQFVDDSYAKMQREYFLLPEDYTSKDITDDNIEFFVGAYDKYAHRTLLNILLDYSVNKSAARALP